MLRRFAVAGAAALALMVAACGTATNTQIATIAGYASTIAGGLKGALPTIAGVVGINPATETTIATAVGDLQVVAAQLQTAASASAAQPLVQQIETDVNTIVASAAKIQGLPSDVQLALEAAQVLLPPMEQVIGMVVPPSAAPAKAIPMSPAAATCILKQQAGQSC